MGARILVAMSGGVDSSVVAALLKREGHDLVGATLQLNPCEDRPLGQSCCGVDAVLAARRVADQLDIPHTVFDCRREFEAVVLAPAWAECKRGRTPSPCIACNQEIKFGWLLGRAARLGASAIATGHYARITNDPPSLSRGLDASKDQSYFLFALNAEQLRRTLTPLGSMSKSEVRVLAREFNLPTAERADSQDACLGSGGDGFAEALRDRFDEEVPPGEMVDETGLVVGRHAGLHRYTIGQRRGLGGGLGGRAYVTRLDAATNRVHISRDPSALVQAAVAIDLLPHFPPPPARCEVQLRSRHRASPAALESLDGGRAVYRFDTPQRAVTPGQAAVLYLGDRVASGGWIGSGDRRLPSPPGAP